VPDGAIVERLPVVNMRSDKAGEREVNLPAEAKCSKAPTRIAGFILTFLHSSRTLSEGVATIMFIGMLIFIRRFSQWTVAVSFVDIICLSYWVSSMDIKSNFSRDR